MRLINVFILGLVVALGSVARGDVQYALEIVPDAGQYDPGQTFTAALMLRELDPSSDGVPSLSLSQGSGLAGISARLERTAGDATLSNFQLAPGLIPFGSNPPSNPTTTPTLWEFSATVLSGSSPGYGVDQSSLQVGTVSVTMGQETSSFTTGNLTRALPNTLLFGQNGFSQTRSDFVTTYGTATFSAVPEPSSLLLTSLALMATVLVFRRRKRT